jgi:hypothetical protein
MPDHHLQGHALVRAQEIVSDHETAKNRFAAGNPELSRVRGESGYICILAMIWLKNAGKFLYDWRLLDRAGSEFPNEPILA